jgi:hypothetical protein
LIWKDMDVICKQISHYKIIDKLGEGGMGIEYKTQIINLIRSIS